MNIKFNGTLIIMKGKKPKGFSSQAAKAAYKDMLKEKDMWVWIDCIGCNGKIPCILTEEILEEL